MKLLADSIYGAEIKLERESIQRGIERYKRLASGALKRGEGAALKPAERLLASWFPALQNAIEARRKSLLEGHPRQWSAQYAKYLFLLQPAQLAVLTLHHTIGGCLRIGDGLWLGHLSMDLSRSICAEWNVLRLKKMGGQALFDLVHSSKCRWQPKRINAAAAKHIRCGKCERRKTCRYAMPGATWPVPDRAALGVALVSMLIDVAFVPDEDGNPRPAFEHRIVTQHRRHYKAGVIVLSDEARKIIADGHIARQYLRPVYQPMIVKPPPWTVTTKGGYIELPVALVKRTRQGEMSQAVFDGINALNATPWRINKRILAVAEELWRTGGKVADIPRAKRLDRPMLPEGVRTVTKTTHGLMRKEGLDGTRTIWPSLDVKRAWKHAAAKVHDQNIKDDSLRMNWILKLGVAQRMASQKEIYFPHQLDFRGRAYCVPLHLNHQGDDVCRGLLEFARPVPLDDMGEYWLKVHMANCCGYDKVSFENRVTWVEQNADRFSRWISDPIANLDWTEVDKPFQALACAYALNDRKEAAHLPVQLDGSNNALQHYAAMLRDEDTAKLVNLLPSDGPCDFYEDVAKIVRRIVGEDAAKGNEIAKRLEDWVNRKLIKQTAMTVFYRVTRIGAKRQLHQHLNEAGFQAEHSYKAAFYLSRVVLDAVASTCPRVHEGMRWLGHVAKTIAEAGKPVEWMTPIGFPAAQPYRNARKYKIDTILQTLRLSVPDDQMPVALRKHVQAFPPNFLHSVDAAHMLATGTNCYANEIDFAGVHDSDWCHATNVPRMLPIILEQFAALHRIPRLVSLYKQMQERYPKLEFDPPPECGTLNVEEVRESQYAFS